MKGRYIMNEELLAKALKEDSEKLYKVLDASYSLKQVEKSELTKIARETNEDLGYELFNDIYYPRLIHDFSLVTRALTKKAMGVKD